MHSGWSNCANILCIRPDNMGDVIMSGPACRALKQSLNCRLTLLTSSAGRLIAEHLNVFDDVIVADVPWVSNANAANADLSLLIEQLRSLDFDAAVIFTVYSQSALPSAMLALMAGIPRRLAYSRENPYGLLTEWVPDAEPFKVIYHQVERDLRLVRQVGAITDDASLRLSVSTDERLSAATKLSALHISQRYIVLHPGVSEEKRTYPIKLWKETAALISAMLDITVVITGSKSEKALCEEIANAHNGDVYSLAGELTVAEFIAVIDAAQLVVSVNTSTIHIASAMQTPQIVLYAQTNPQHTPWQTPAVTIPFSVNKSLMSRNEIVRWVSDQMYQEYLPYPEPRAVAQQALEMVFPQRLRSYEKASE
jgi:ADP-heptose:LPS heptosyltransferase